MDDSANGIVLFRKTLPFHPSRRQVIYVESHYNKAINDFIVANFDWIKREIEKLEYEFCYFPEMSERFQSPRYISYYTPYRPPFRICIQGHECEEDEGMDSCCLSPYLKRGHTLSPSFIIYDENKSDNGYYAFLEFRLGEPEDLKSSFLTYLSYLSELREKYLESLDSIRYSITDEIESYLEEETADRRFSQEVEALMEDVRTKIKQLRVYGVDEMVLNSLLNPQPYLSTLVISAEGRITLPGYQNREIKMTPLVKAVYFLFLRHPEGIVFKNLPDYREELLMIYKKLTGRVSDEDVLRSIEDVTNPCKNSINEKCARIREAFIREFDDRIARTYYITGSRATAKKITLPCDYVIWVGSYM